MDSQLIRLKNGLRVVFVDRKTFPTLTTLLLVGAGSRYENEANNGIAHFFEHMAFKGSKKYPSVLKISTILDGLGSEHNAFTSKDYTGYWIKSPTKHFSTVVDILAEMVLRPLLVEEEIDREKGVIVQEINMYEDTPQYKVLDLFETLLYPNNPLGYLTTGEKDTVINFTRQTFLDYMGRHYRPNNAVLVMAGGLNLVDSSKARYRVSRPPHPKGTQAIDSKQVFSPSLYHQIIEEKFGKWDGQKRVDFTSFEEKQTKPAVLVYPKKTEQVHLVLGYRGLSRNDPDRYVQAVLMAVLGGGMSSRLFSEVRERRGLCYYIQSGSEAFAETGYVFTRAGLNSDIKKINEAIGVIVQEHQKISAGKLTDKEITKAKEMLKGRLILSLEDSNNLSSFFGKKLLLENKLENSEEVMEKIDAVTKKHIVSLANKIFIQNKFNLALIGPIDQNQIRKENYS